MVSPKENPSSRIIPRSEPAKGMELLWQPEVRICVVILFKIFYHSQYLF